jgi:hypothetical protein
MPLPSSANVQIQLLPAIRSEEIIPELAAITLDSHREDWQRVYALRAISIAKNDFYFPELESLARQSLAERVTKFRDGKTPYFDYHDFLSEINNFVGEHSTNRTWFLHILDELDEPFLLVRFLQYVLLFRQPNDYRQELLLRLKNAFDKAPQFISLRSISHFYRESDTAKEWCEKHFDRILALCAKEPNNWEVWRLAKKWNRLRESLTENIDGWELGYVEKFLNFAPRKVEPFRASPLQNFLEGCYLSSLEGNKKAYQRLVEVARLWKGNIPFRAVATHYLGKLQDHYDVFPILSSFLHYPNDDWGDEVSPYSPIRFEAGEALLSKPSAAVWELMVDAFFVRPSDFLCDFQLDWIRHLTDSLSGIDAEYDGVRHKVEERAWFRALADVSKEDAEKMIQSVF